MRIVQKRIEDLQPGEVVVRGSAFVVGTVEQGDNAPDTHTRVLARGEAGHPESMQMECINGHMVSVVVSEGLLGESSEERPSGEDA